MTGLDTHTTSKTPAPLSLERIQAKVAQCPALPSLTRNAREIITLLNSGQAYSHQICEVVQRDPSLAARVLKMVNSVYFGLAEPVTTIEAAVFFVGTEQIRDLALATPVIEDFQRLTAKSNGFVWRPFWQHCVGVAILTREIITSMVAPTEETDYVGGLVHDVGKIVMAAAFPRHFAEVHWRLAQEPAPLLEVERAVLGVDHAQLGGMYLRRMNLPPILADVARFHHDPTQAQVDPTIPAAVQLADLIMKHCKIGKSGDERPVSLDFCLAASGWNILAPNLSTEGRATAYAGWSKTIEGLPAILETII